MELTIQSNYFEDVAGKESHDTGIVCLTSNKIVLPISLSVPSGSKANKLQQSQIYPSGAYKEATLAISVRHMLILSDTKQIAGHADFINNTLSSELLKLLILCLLS